MNFVSKIKENPLLIFQVILIVLLILLAIVFVVVMKSEDLEWIFNLLGVSEKEQPKYEVLKFLGIGMGGVLVALQALMSHRRAKAMEDTAQAQADAAQAQARANENTEQGLRQERLKNAIEHLGDEKDTVRLGGAYELFHLAEDSKDLRKTALDMLCLHIRQTTGKKKYKKKHKSKPSEEVQSLLTLLFVQEHEVFKDLQINLQGSWLNGANLGEARFGDAILVGVHLQGANLWRAYLQGAVLRGANLQGANLTGVHLQKANFKGAHLQEANFLLAHLQEADISEAELQGAKLNGAYLQSANLDKAHLQGADLFGAHLQGANLTGAELQRVFLAGTRLQGANLQGANLQRANLIEVQLQGANLQGADLTAANLQGLDDAKVQQLQGAGKVRWSSDMSFAERIKSQIDQETDLSDVVFAGGLTKEDVDSLVEGLSDEKANKLREKLEPHIGKPTTRYAITGAYVEEELEQWFAEYERVMSEVPGGDS